MQMMATPTIAPTYAARREPYLIIILKLGAAIVILLGAFGLFLAAVAGHNQEAAKLSGWLVAPVVWLVSSAYGTHKKIPAEDRAAADLRKARIAAQVAVGVLVSAVVLIGGTIAVKWEQKQARQERIHRLLSEGRALGPANADFRRRMAAVLEREPQTFAAFQSQCVDLESVLDSNGATLDKARLLIDKLEEEFADSPDALSTLALLKRALGADAKIFGYLREEIACSRVLSSGGKDEQAAFRERCLVPVQAKVSPILLEEEQLLRELQKQGTTLPPDVAEALR